jgi:hypothetical protein
VCVCVCVFVCDGNMQHACVYLNVRCGSSRSMTPATAAAMVVVHSRCVLVYVCVCVCAYMQHTRVGRVYLNMRLCVAGGSECQRRQ